MPLPAEKQSWPPKPVMDLLPAMATWDAWYCGDPDKLLAVYGGGVPANDQTGFFASQQGGFKANVTNTIRRWFWGERQQGPERRTKLHVPIAADLCQASADLLFADPPTLSLSGEVSPDDPVRARLEELAGDSLYTAFAEAAEIAAALGGVYVRVTWDESVEPDRPFITSVHADAALPEFCYGRLVAVTFWRIVHRDEKRVWRHLERHELDPARIGVVLHGLYEGTNDNLGMLIPLTEMDATRALAASVDENGTISTLTPGLAVAYVPNQRPQRRWRSHALGSSYGRSDLDGVEQLMDGLDETYCADEQTEILTENGWTGYRDLRAGDHVLTLNHDTGLSEWQPVQEVCVFPAQDRQMVSMETRSHSSLTTPTHRWPVERPHYRGGVHKAVSGFDRAWATSATFRTDDLLPIAADCADLPIEPKYADAFVELVAWFWTEGHIRRLRDGTAGPNVTMTQSHKANLGHCSRIRGALTRLFGPACDLFPRNGKRPDSVPRWRESVARDNVVFSLNAAAGALVQAVAPGRVPAHSFLLSLTRAQLSLFLDVSMLADNSGKCSLAQKDRAAAEAFQFAAILAGYSTSIRPTLHSTRGRYPMWNVRMRSERVLWAGRVKQQTVAYGGEVWCPRTANQTWLARRNGTVYFTGNTSWMRDLRLGKARVFLADTMLRDNGPGKGSSFDADQEIYAPLPGLLTSPKDASGGGLPITPYQAAIRYEEHRATSQDFMEQILRTAGYSAQTFGEDEQARGATTATEVEARQQRSQLTRKRKIRLWRPAVEEIVAKLLAVDGALFSGPAAADVEVEAGFNEGVSESIGELAQTAALLKQAQAASTKTLVQLVHPDWEAEAVDAEVALITDANAVPDPMSFRGGSIDLTPGATGAAGSTGDAPPPGA